jgi:hypothetical protein
MVKNLFTAVTLTLLVACLSVSPIRAQMSSTDELDGGWWFDGTGFVRQKLYVVNGVFEKKRPAHIDGRHQARRVSMLHTRSAGLTATLVF